LVGFFGDGVFALFSPVLSFDWRLEGCSCRKKMAELIKLEKKRWLKFGFFIFLLGLRCNVFAFVLFISPL
jgi:hypothetical protein